MYTLGTAARAAGVSKSTIHRAIQNGVISARSKDKSGYEIDPAELHRVFPPASQGVPSNSSAGTSIERYATPEENTGNTLGTTHTLEIRCARLEAQLDAMREVLELERKRTEDARQHAEELRRERDRWSGMAEASQRQLVDLTKRPSGFLGWLRRLG